MFEKIDNDLGFFKKQHKQFCSALNERDIEEFSKCKTDEDRFSYVYSNTFVRSNMVSLSDSNKNANLSKRLREDGNKAYQAGDVATALSNYSKAILKCPQDNSESLEELSLAFANRSAVFYRIGDYERAIDDVDTALELNYPLQLKYKVLDRKARCLLALKQHTAAIEAFRCTLTSLDDAKLPLEKRQKWQKDVQIMLAMLAKTPSIKNENPKVIGQILPKVTGHQNKIHPAVSDSVTFKTVEKAGRYAEASRTIKPGDVIAVEKPHCSVLLSERSQTHCFQCFKRLVAPHPCPLCCNVAFCSKMCKDIAMKSHHQSECSVLPTVWASGASVTCYMALRMFTQKNKDYFIKLKPSLNTDNFKLENKDYNCDDYRSVFYLERNQHLRSVEDFLHRAHMAVFLFKCLDATGYFEKSVGSEDSKINGKSNPLLSGDKVYIGGLILHNLQFLQFNAHEVSELVVTDGDIDKSTTLFLGGAIYPTLSLFNHSCNPAFVRYFQGTTVICSAVRTTFKGEMIAENYGPSFTLTPKNERQNTLKKQYWFDCECVACEEDWPLFSELDESKMRFRCETVGCSNIIIVPTDTLKFMALCPNCDQHMNLLKGLKALQDTDSMFRVARSFMTEGDIGKAFAKFMELLQMLDEILAPPFRDFHLCQQAVRTCVLSFGNTYYAGKNKK